MEVPPGTPIVADKGHDSDALRDEIDAAGYVSVIPHRKNRVKPSRNDGRRLRRYRHSWLIERTKARLHCYRGLAVRWAHYTFMYENGTFGPYSLKPYNGCETVSSLCR